MIWMLKRINYLQEYPVPVSERIWLINTLFLSQRTHYYLAPVSEMVELMINLFLSKIVGLIILLFLSLRVLGS